MHPAMTDTKKFIECVKKYPMLYNTRHKDFKDTLKKTEVWELVANEMNEESEVLRTKWKGLKDGYTKFKKQSKNTSGTAKTYINWCWGPHLAFLDKFMRKRKFTSYNRAATQNTTSPLKIEQGEKVLQGSNDCEKLEPVLPKVATPPPVTQAPSLTSHIAADPLSCGVASIPDEEIERIATIIRSKSEKNTDAVHDLFQSYAKTFNKFSIQTQTMLKVEMAKLFADAELREHMYQNPSAIQTISKTDPDFIMEANPL